MGCGRLHTLISQGVPLLYFEIIRDVVEQGIESYASINQEQREKVLSQMRSQIDRTSAQHRTSEPEIDYGDPLCRLGYLFRHGGVNATFVEKALCEDERLQQALSHAQSKRTLKVCSLGGGPGTELLGFGKYLLNDHAAMPNRIDFTVLDSVHHWSETWDLLAERTEQAIQTELERDKPIIASHFLTFDVLNPSSYVGYTSRFKDVDVVIYNYLFSENQGKLDVAQQAVKYLATTTSQGCVFLVIDRLEYRTSFQTDIVSLFEPSLGPIQIQEFAGTMDSDEQASVFGKELLDALTSPRVQFRTGSGGATVFWFTAMKGGGA